LNLMSTRNPTVKSRVLTATMLALIATTASAAEEETGYKVPGLPSAVDWTFNLDATWGFFGFKDSLYQNPKPDDISGDLSDNWMEGSIKPALSGVYKLSEGSELYGKVSVVGERTYHAPPPLVGGEASSFGVEDLYIGWRSGDIDVTFGRTRYRLGHGMLLYDGNSEGGSRGGYWTNARQAFELAGIARYAPGKNKIEAFYLDRDELPESDSDSKLWGLNYEYSLSEDATLGATYMRWSADPAIRPERDGLDVYNVRAFLTPLPWLKGFSVEAEYAKEDNGDLLDSQAYNVEIGYQLEMTWKPKISYRYAVFEGDDPNSPENEAFDGLFTGFYDWGTWWQGEIAGEYFVSNSNLITHRLRVHANPTESISTGLMFFDFLLDNPASAGVTSDKVAYELDWYADWTVNDNFIVSFIAAVADPKEAVEQSTGRTDTFVYGMIFAAYSF
jgi:Alginate export